MSAALKLCKVNDKFQDPLFIFLELIRGGVLHGKLWGHRAYSGGPSFGEGALSFTRYRLIRVQQTTETESSCIAYLSPLLRTEDEKKSMLLIMRVLSIVPLQFKVRSLLISFGSFTC